ncbi:hypothetical protein NFI96_003801 [Prochilodus magdalenae]|nr:hypothetical protein NFI96_003801 [Prochilodus magdalenae]
MMNEEDTKTLEEYEVDLEEGVDEVVGAGLGCATHSGRGQKAYTMYHGTTMENAYKIQLGGFIPSPDGMLGRGVYVSRNFEKARRYPLCPGGQALAVLRLNVRVGKVKKIDYQGHPLQKTWHYHGYDTAWVPPNCGMTPSGLEEDCVYDPHRITVLQVMPNYR